MVGGLGDADAGRSKDAAWTKTVICEPQAGVRGSEIAGVVAEAGDVEGFGEASGAGGEFEEIAGSVNGDAPGAGHWFDAREGFEGTNQNAASLTLGFAGDVETVMIAVDEINVSVTGRAEQDRVAGGSAGGGVSGGIVLAEIGFNFDQAGGKDFCSGAEQEFANQIAGDAAGRAGEKGSSQRMSGHGVSLFGIFTTGETEGAEDVRFPSPA
jgi:hypothetical protein